MGAPLSVSAALVSFSGGQDSTTALAWALSQYETVETIGFRYGQKHLVEMKCRHVVREAIAELNPAWKARLGPDHVIELDLIGQIAKNIASPAGYPLLLSGRARYQTRLGLWMWFMRSVQTTNERLARIR
jgi:tRNA(Ile)-lysidine synthase TilS/MesJ